MSRPNRRRAEEKKKDAWGKLLIAMAFILAAGGVGGYFWAADPAHRIDNNSLCPASGPTGREVVLVDSTDKLSTPQREDLRNKLREIRDTLPKGAELSIYTVAEISNQLLTAAITRCNPGDPHEANPLYQNPEMLERAWRERFATPLETVIVGLTGEDATSPHSPIMESIQSVAISAFGSGPQPVSRRLVVVSDMLQNTADFSHYRGFEDFKAFRNTDYYKRVKPDLRGVDVTIIFLRRDHTVAAAKLMDFWQSYFSDAGAKVDLVKAVQG